jgi:hypothetical protein
MVGNAGRSVAGLVVVAAIIASPLARGAALEGDYTGTGNSFFENLSFRSGGKVRLTFGGMTKVGTYEVDGKEVLITVGNETNVFTLDADGCVVGGGFLGKYCKGGDKAATGSGPDKRRAATSGGKPTALSGTYKTGNNEMNIALDFKGPQKVRITVAGTKARKQSADATYKVAGDRVTISVPDGSPPLILTRNGNTLEGAPDGEAVKMKFVKQ